MCNTIRKSIQLLMVLIAVLTAGSAFCATPSVTSFAINSGAATTSSQTATLNNTCTGTPTQYMASESSSFSGASWITYSTAPSFTLSAGFGTKTVYFKVKNSSGTSAVVSDTIVETVIDSMQYTTNSAAQAAWPATAAPSVTIATVGGVKCVDFESQFPNSIYWFNFWTKSGLNLNLSDANYNICFQIKMSNPTLFSMYEIYLSNGVSGFDYYEVPLASNQWQTVEVPQSAFLPDVGASWSSITQVRIKSYGAIAGTSDVYISNLQAVPTTSPNLLSNSGFETCTTGTIPDFWGSGHFGLGFFSDRFATNMGSTTSGWNSQWIDSAGHRDGGSGTQCLCIISNPTDPELQACSSYVSVDSGGHYTLSAWLKSSVANLPVILGLADVGSTQVWVDSAGANVWQRYTLANVTATSTFTSVCGITPNGAGTLWIDDVQLEKNSVATTYAPADSDPYMIVPAVHRTSPATNNAPIIPGPSSVSVSYANSRFLVNNSLFIPYAVGWSTGLPDLPVLQAIAQAGFNTVVAGVDSSAMVSSVGACLDNANACGLKVILSFNPDIDSVGMSSFVSNLKSKPAVIAWYVYDEPMTDAQKAAALADYNAVKAADTSGSGRPAYINYCGYPYYNATDSVGDIASMDDYAPGPATQARNASMLSSTGKLSWLWLQASGYAFMMPRDPTGPEEECMVYSALINGVRGIKFWVYMPHSLELWGEMRQLGPEIQTLTPILYSTDTPPTVSTTTAGIQLLGKTYNAQPYIIAVNDSYSSVSATLNVPSGYPSANVLFENRYVSISSSGQIVDTFGGFQRGVYRLLTQSTLGSLIVNVTLQNYSGDLSLLPIRVDLLQNGNVVYTTTVTPTSNPATVTFTDIPAGSYYVRAKAAGFVLPSMPLVSVSASTYASQNISLVNGDVDCDNIIRTNDANVVQKNMGDTNQ